MIKKATCFNMMRWGDEMMYIYFFHNDMTFLI